MAYRIKQEKKFKKSIFQALHSFFLDLRYGGKLLDAEKESKYFSKGCYHTQSVEYEELKFVFDDNSWVAVRPSGTEPKIKVYYSVRGETLELAEDRLENYRNIIKAKLGLLDK